jgi:hypothetical protein
MDFKQLFIFVEGPDDERFVNKIVLPHLQTKYSFIKLIKYASMTKNAVEALIKTCKQKVSYDYLFMCDMDARGDTSYCITSRKSKAQNKYGQLLETSKIVVVKEEIESWYLAGITTEQAARLKIKRVEDTSVTTKEEFENMIPKNFISPNDFMVEILKNYSLEQGMAANGSLNYFAIKYLY